MKWLRPLIIFLLIATPSWAGFWSNFPGVGAGTVLNGIIIDNSTIDNSIINDSTLNNPTFDGTSTYLPGTIVNYDPSTIINGPNGSVWNINGITNLKNLTIAPGGSITAPPGSTVNLPDGSVWTQTGLVYATTTVITGPNGSTWNSTGITNLKNLTMANGAVITIPITGMISGPDGGTWTSTGLNNIKNLSLQAGGTITIGGIPAGGACPANQFYIALSSSLVPTCAPITSIPGPVTINQATFTGNTTFPDGSVWSITGISNSSPLGLILTANVRISGANNTLRIVGGITEPTPTPAAGSFFYNTTGNYMEYWNGTSWITMAGLTGGACAAGDFVNSISPAGVITCGTPSGGGGSLPTPVSIGNGGLGQGVAPSAGQILVASGPTAYNPVTMHGDATINSAGAVTVVSIGGVTGPFQPLTVTTATPPASPVVGQLWFDPVKLQTYIWYNDGTSSQWVAVVNLNFATLNSPNINNPTFTGTMNFPDGSTWTTVGLVAPPTPPTSKFYTFHDGATWSSNGISDSTEIDMASGGAVIWMPFDGNYIMDRGSGVSNQWWGFDGLGNITTLALNERTQYAPIFNANPIANNAVVFGNPSGLGTTPPANTSDSMIVGGPINSQYGNSLIITQGSLVDNHAQFINVNSPLAPTSIMLSNGTVGLYYGTPSANPAVYTPLVIATFNHSGSTISSNLNVAGTFSINGTPMTGGPWLPVNNPTYTGLLTTNGTGYVLTVPQGIVQFSNQLIVNTLDVQGSGNPQLTLPDGSDWWNKGLAFPGSPSTTSVSSGVFWYANVGTPNPQAPPYIASLGAIAGTLNIAQGAWQTLGGVWNAGQTSATIINQTGSAINFLANTGLTVNGTYTATQVASINPAVNVAAPWSGLLSLVLTGINQTSATAANLIQATANGNWGANISVANTATGTTANSGFGFRSDASTAWMTYTNTGYTAQGPNVLPSTLQLGSTGTNGIALFTNAALSPGPPIVLWSGNSMVGAFVNGMSPPNNATNVMPINGLSIPDFTGTGLQVGDLFVASAGRGNMNLATGAWYNPGTGQWVATGTGPYTLINSGGPGTIAMFSAPGTTAGANLANWTRQFAVNANGVFVNHLNNDNSQGGPSIIAGGGTFMTGSGDSFGYINVTAWPVTMQFSHPFAGNPACVATGAAGLLVIIASNAQSPSQIQFVCSTGAGGACPAGWFQYHCGNVG